MRGQIDDKRPRIHDKPIKLLIRVSLVFLGGTVLCVWSGLFAGLLRRVTLLPLLLKHSKVLDSNTKPPSTGGRPFMEIRRRQWTMHQETGLWIGHWPVQYLWGGSLGIVSEAELWTPSPGNLYENERILQKRKEFTNARYGMMNNKILTSRTWEKYAVSGTMKSQTKNTDLWDSSLVSTPVSLAVALFIHPSSFLEYPCPGLMLGC